MNAEIPDNDKVRLQAIIDDSIACQAKASNTHQQVYSLIKPLLKPVLAGKENLPEQPFLMVGNHSQFAMDVPLVSAMMKAECGRFVRGMADRVLFSNDFARNLFISLGSIEGNPFVCSTFMEAGADLMVFPGGGTEINKPLERLYELNWGRRTGFVRMAALHGYTILPFATVGPEEFYGRYIERQELLDSWVGKLIQKSGIIDIEARPDLFFPVPKGLWGTLVPKPQRLYMSLGEPIDLSKYKGQVLSKSMQTRIRNRVAKSIEEQIRSLLLLRVQSRHTDGWIRKLLT